VTDKQTTHPQASPPHPHHPCNCTGSSTWELYLQPLVLGDREALKQTDDSDIFCD
jgi:hypothetical protein